MLTLVTGLPGRGKTLHTIWKLKKLLEQDKAIAEAEGRKPRPIFQHNINGLNLEWNHLEDLEKWFECPVGSFIVVDEAQEFFPPMQNGAVRPDFYTKFSTHRHQGFDIFLITQDASLLDFKVRTMCGQHIHVTRFQESPFSTIYTFPSVRNTSNEWYKKDVDVIKTQWKHPKEVFDDYKSAEVHTSISQFPWKKLSAIAAVALLPIFGVGYLLTVFLSTDEPNDALDDVQAVIDPIPLPDYFEDRASSSDSFTADDLVPTIPGVPSSAPIYSNLFQVTAAPRVDGCSLYSFGGNKECTCNDQRGNIVDTPFQFCEAFVKRGFFDFTISDIQYSEGRGASAAAPASTPLLDQIISN